MSDRIQRVLDAMQASGLTQFLVADPHSIAYLTGIKIDPGERLFALLLRTDGEHRFFINRLFPLPTTEIPISDFSDTDDSIGLISTYVEGGVLLGIDKIWPARFLLPLMAEAGASGYVDASHTIDTVRAIKDEIELALMVEASRINDLVIQEAKEHLYIGITELELADFILGRYLHHGAEGPSFSPIVAFGEHAADPHHENSDRALLAGDIVLLDIGCIKDGYCSDMTRSFFTGPADPELDRIYELVLEANLAAISIICPGVRMSEIDAAARSVITDGGYGPEFTHRLGHFIGREVHEYGDVSSQCDWVAKPGMVFSIEPGIYLPGKFGVRIEDLVVVTEDGCETLNHVSKTKTVKIPETVIAHD